MPDFLQQLLSFMDSNSGFLSLIVVVSTALFLYFDFRGDRRAQREEQRAQGNLGLERRRLTEVNIKLQHELRVTSPKETDEADDLPAEDQGRKGPSSKGENPFAVFHLPLHNIGDGPVDILGMLVSARVLTTANTPTIGRRSRDVQWNDYQQSYWDDEQDDGLFCGISTTKHLVSSGDYFVRLAANEEIALRRIDAVNNVGLLRGTLDREGEINLMYRVFMIARGYPLGEILRQLGGGPPDPLLNLTEELLQFQALAQPVYFRWREVQEALLNLNQFAFRLAVSETTPDPLGQIATPNAWRFFLLHHWEFASGRAGAPGNLGKGVAGRGREPFIPTRDIPKVTDRVRDTYPDLQVPNYWRQNQEEYAKFCAVRDECRALLQPMVDSWHQLMDTIARCNEYTTRPYDPEKEFARPRKAPEGCPNEGYPRRIHSDNDYYQRWLALLKEGYLISRPFPRLSNKFRHSLAPFPSRLADTVPPDPRILEPFVMREHYFLVPIHKQNDRTTQTGAFH